MGPLQGTRILDMTSVLMGPYATQLLGDMGADVIKVEAPDGDIVRQIGPMRHPDMGGMFLHVNRSKRSIVMDLKDPAGREALLRLAKTCDVLVYNVRPQAMERLDLSYEVVLEANPRIIYAGVFGYGQDGPYAALPAYDDLIQGAAAIPSIIAEAGDGTPRYIPLTVADRVVGLHALSAILAALLHRQRTGEGQRIDIPMFETIAGFVLGDHMGGLTYDPPMDEGGYARLLSRHRRPYRTSDGYICALIYNDKQWRRFFEAIGQREAINDPRFTTHTSRTAHIDEIYSEVSEIFLTRSTADWEKLLADADIPVMPLHTLRSILSDPHLVATDFFKVVDHPTEGKIRSMRVPSQWSRSQPEPVRQAPQLGEHTIEILKEAALSDSEIETLLECKTVRSSKPNSMPEI
jgi:crotonobetainyl-CoA:carnitine CoA-transferase CaiB-like acyl-CoA transferase